MQVDMFVDAKSLTDSFTAYLGAESRSLTLHNPARSVHITLLPVVYNHTLFKADADLERAAVTYMVRTIVHAYLDATGLNLGDLFPDEVQEAIEAVERWY